MKKNRVAIIGHFGGDKEFLDGQTVKTKILYKELVSHTDWKIKKIDTYYKQKNPLKLLIQTFGMLISKRKIIVLLSLNGANFYFPLLYIASRILKTRVYNDVIGGNWALYVAQNRKLAKYMKGFVVNWVETSRLKKNIEAYGVENCEVIPNFKNLNILSEGDLGLFNSKTFKFCTFSRVVKEKGIEEAIKAVESINSEAKDTICALDIYGQIDKKYEAHFKEIMTSVSSNISYKGIISYDRSVETLKGYSALLFPTYWDGEGFPGTIVDAYSSGLPVIATDWNCNSELIENGKTGILYSGKESELKNAIQKFIDFDEQTRLKMQKNCLAKAKEYMPEKWITEIIKKIEE